MAGAGPLTAADLAARTGTSERYVREWLNAQAAGGYVDYHPETERYSLSSEQAMLLADEGGPAFFVGAFQTALAAIKIEPKLMQAFRSGEGVGWHEHDQQLFHGTERLFRAGYVANLTSDWIPALDGVEAKLRAGARVADVGCGFGASTIIMAQAYPNSTFTGFDYHEATLVCTPASLAQEVGLALGAQAGEQRLRNVVTAGGFTRFRRATQTPFNLVFEVQP